MKATKIIYYQTTFKSFGNWAVPLAITLAFSIWGLGQFWPWLASYPSELVVPFDRLIASIMVWIKSNFSWLTRSITAVIDIPLRFAFGLLAKGFKFGHGESAVFLPRLSWLGVTLFFGWLGYIAGGFRLSLLTGTSFLLLAIFKLWDSAMLTLALIIVCVPICLILGLFVGILGYNFPKLNQRFIAPFLDVMQTMPTFSYLIPMLLLFGASPVSALIATIFFASPPMVRATTLGLNKVSEEIKEFAKMVGCTKNQQLWRVLIPSAKPSLMIGVNQVIMLALNMVIISSMIGAGGLGYNVLLALRALKVGQAMEAGLAIVLIAIVLDRISQAFVRKNIKTITNVAGKSNFGDRHSNVIIAICLLTGTTFLGFIFPAFINLPDNLTFTTAIYWKIGLDWVVINWFDYIDACRVFILLNFLNPLRSFFEALPWSGVAIVLSTIGWRLGGVRLAFIVGTLTCFCAATGLWVPAMQTLYLCGAAVLAAAAIGIPIGIWSARSDKVQSYVLPIIDGLQTIPSFCFIIPVVMLFRIGDVTALIATVAFAIVPCIRYTNHGIRQVSNEVIEAGRVSGCTKWQLFRHIQVPLALPEIMLGVNQTILLALSMIIICAMVGTRDLGQEIFKALAKAEPGRGIVAGLVIAFIGITADRLINAWNNRMREKRGI
ncbi:MAG: ABC transporter permease [Rhodobacter sp. BACL10 MAG-120419-bin15]|jgi:glycine betaine/proline transport system permease protein|nr:MAG: ABC transporter permease [Rhodobacter sp. BACL10 MAG-120419-bin15]|tara:strand:+ start:3548 stop:5530 length:1983 start_codon:yes stop_codon:yes gene_type:complete